MIFLKVIFLDFDGVLNGLSSIYKVIYDIAGFFHLRKLLHKIYDTYGIRTLRVFWLSRIIKHTDAKVVLSSSWRNAWDRPYKECGNRGRQLQRKFKLFKIPVIGKTPFIGGKRGEEIKAYLELHPEIENFVILDDEYFDINEHFPNNLVLTSNNKIGTAYEKSGLNRKHVKQAISILKEGYYDNKERTSMFYYKINGLKKNGQKDTIYIKGIRELYRAEIFWFLNSIHSNSEYIDMNVELIDENTASQVSFIENVVLGGNFYSIRFRTKMGSTLHICISGTAFPSEEIIMKYNKYLSKYKQIVEIFSIEKISATKVIDEYGKRRDYLAKLSVQTKTDPNFEHEQQQIWTFPDMWLTPYEFMD